MTGTSSESPLTPPSCLGAGQGGRLYRPAARPRQPARHHRRRDLAITTDDVRENGRSPRAKMICARRPVPPRLPLTGTAAADRCWRCARWPAYVSRGRQDDGLFRSGRARGTAHADSRIQGGQMADVFDGPEPGPRGSQAHAGRAGERLEPGHRSRRGPASAAQEDDRAAHHRGIQARGAGGDVLLAGRARLPPDGDKLADQATGQEQEAKEVLARLDKLDAATRSSSG